jgi:preprotein translocase subunit SecG
MFAFLLIVQVVVCICIIGLVMMQQGKGADMGAAFGSGAAGTVFGTGGGGSFLTRTTAVLAMVFFINCLLIASPLIRDRHSSSGSIAEVIEQSEADSSNASTGTPAVKVQEAAAGKAETAVTEGDLPAAPAAPRANTGTSDLPE